MAERDSLCSLSTKELEDIGGRFYLRVMDQEPWRWESQTPDSWLENEGESLLVSPKVIRKNIEHYPSYEGTAEAGVYFIFDADGGLEYVGIADNMNARLRQHEKGSPFRVEWFSEVSPLPPFFLKRYEDFYIHYCQPRWNKYRPRIGGVVQEWIERAKAGDLWR